MKKYTIQSGGITVHFTADQVCPEHRVKLSKELIEINDTEALDTDEFLSSQKLNVGSYTTLSITYPTVGDLARATDKELLSMRYFGKVRLSHLREALKKGGY